MPKKKMTQEEIKKEIDRQVAIARIEWLKERELESEKEFLEKTMDNLAVGYKLGGLKLVRTLNLAKQLIDGSILPEDEKEMIRRHFANAIVWTGARGIKEDEWEAARQAENAVLERLREPI